MDHYVNIHLLPDSEFTETILLSSLYTKLHKMLHDLTATDIGVSFPKYQATLGNVLRIHGQKISLNRLLGINWIGGMLGYCEISPVRTVPTYAKFRTVSRKQATMSQSKLRRLIMRGSISESEISQYKAKMFSKSLDMLYLELISSSRGQKYRRYIELGPLLDQPVSGEFDQFGLSRKATIPWFD